MTNTPNPTLLARAVAIAAVAHQAQVDKSGAAYILHPLRMMMKARTEDERIVAMLHDVVEDTEWTFEALRGEGFPDYIIEALDGVTNREGESYEEFVERAAKNPISAAVKLLDLEDNMTITRLSHVTEKDLARLAKYHAAHKRLTALIEMAGHGNTPSPALPLG